MIPLVCDTIQYITSNNKYDGNNSLPLSLCVYTYIDRMPSAWLP